MRMARRHPWDLTPLQAIALQKRLAARARLAPPARFSEIHAVVGVDVAYSPRTDRCYAAAVALHFPSLSVIEQQSASGPSAYPYVPGLLSFREIPALAAALKKLRTRPDVLLCDGQGLAHMRRFGLASHLGWLYDAPSVGCAKTRLIGRHGEPGPARAQWTNLWHEGEKIGEVVRTRDGVKPLYVSPGYRMNFAVARRLVLACCAGRRLPEPIRLAHQATAREYQKAEGKGPRDKG
jgi:deoxyribonuclease V